MYSARFNLYLMEWKGCVVVLLVSMSVVSCHDNMLDTRWETFKDNNNRKYNNRDVESYRRMIWEEKVKKIEEHNRQADMGVHSYWLKETEWDDLTFDEFLHYGTEFDPNDIHRVKRAKRDGSGDCFGEHLWRDTFPYPHDKITTLPTNVDWTQKGYVTTVKNQGSFCGFCWAFSAVGAIEGQVFKKTKELTSLSPQNLVDCSTHYGCNGGGLPTTAFDYVVKNGIASESSYPYTGVQGTCKSFMRSANITGYKTINSEKELMNAVAYVGPVSVGIRAGTGLQNVGVGIYTDCGPELNHAVLVVGYGYVNNTKVWKIKNSWGPNWGNNGYFYMTRQKSNACGISEYASYPTLSGVSRGSVTAGQVPSLTATVGTGVSTEHSMLALSLSLLLTLIPYTYY